MRPAQLCFFRCIGHLLQRSQEAPNRRWHGVRLSVTKVFWGPRPNSFFFLRETIVFFFFISSLHILKANGFIYIGIIWFIYFPLLIIMVSIMVSIFFHIYIYIFIHRPMVLFRMDRNLRSTMCEKKKHPCRCIPGCHEWPIIWVKRTQKAEHVDCFDCQQSVFVEYT